VPRHEGAATVYWPVLYRHRTGAVALSFASRAPKHHIRSHSLALTENSALLALPTETLLVRTSRLQRHRPSHRPAV